MSDRRCATPLDVPKGDRKRIKIERDDFSSHVKQEPDVSKNFDRRPQPHCKNQRVKRKKVSKKRNRSRNHNSGFDNRRQMCFQDGFYINSVRQSESRCFNSSDLRRHLFNIDLRYLRNPNFYTALDLTEELASNLRKFVDIRNELGFLRRLAYQQCLPFSYNHINISNLNGLQNRISFLENESVYRSNLMDQLFYQLQGVVHPSIIDGIRCMHGFLYESTWINCKRYWSSMFQRIKLEKHSSTVNIRAHNNQQPTHKRWLIEEEFDDTDNVNNIKSATFITPKAEATNVQVEKSDEQELSFGAPSEISRSEIHKSSKSMEELRAKLLAECSAECQNVTSGSNDADAASSAGVDKVGEGEDSDCEIIEPNIVVITVSDDDDDDNGLSNQ